MTCFIRRRRTRLWKCGFYFSPSVCRAAGDGQTVQMPHMVGCVFMLGMTQTSFNFTQCLVSVSQPPSLLSPFVSFSPHLKAKLRTIKVHFASNLPNTMLTPPVMRSLLCISQISRGMSLKAYTFN